MGTLVVISSPSGGGKNTIINRLLQLFPNSTRFITTTTRIPRVQEKNGRDYHFVSHEAFEQLRDENKLVEYNFYAGEYYGSEKERLNEDLQKFDWVFVALDVNGKKNLDKLKIAHRSIFLLPESLDVFRDRIIQRGSVTPEALEERMEIARQELQEAKKYDFQIVNPQGNIQEAVEGIVGFLTQK